MMTKTGYDRDGLLTLTDKVAFNMKICKSLESNVVKYVHCFLLCGAIAQMTSMVVYSIIVY